MKKPALKLIAFSGIDGAGKSTQIDRLSDALCLEGYKPKYLWTRGGYTGPFNALKSLVRKVMGKKAIPSGRTEAREKILGKSWVRSVWLNLAMLDLALVYGVYVRWLGLTGETVVADRYLKDTWIDFSLNFPGSNFDRWPLWKFLEFVTPKPDHAFMLLIPVEESSRRGKLKNEPFPDSAEVLGQRLEYYQRFSREGHGLVIDCMRSIDEISNEIVGVVFKGSANEG